MSDKSIRFSARSGAAVRLHVAAQYGTYPADLEDLSRAVEAVDRDELNRFLGERGLRVVAVEARLQGLQRDDAGRLT